MDANERAIIQAVIDNYDAADSEEKYDECKWGAFDGVEPLRKLLANAKVEQRPPQPE